MKPAAPVLAALVALSSPAIAQTPFVEIADATTVEAFGATADTIDDWDVHAADGTRIGDVEDVLGSDAQTPTALAVDFEGNGGYGDRDVAVPLDLFTYADGRLTLAADAAAVQAMPDWDD